FGFRDLLLLRTTKGLLESGVPMRRIRRIWASLREQLEANLPLTSIAIHTDGEEVVASDGAARWQPDSGQFLLNFEASEIAERAAIGAVGREDPAPHVAANDSGPSAEQLYEAGCALEESSPEQAREAYERALEIDPGVADVHVNLGRQPYVAGALRRAQPHYREAARLDPDAPTPHFNQGVLLEDGGRQEEGIH